MKKQFGQVAGEVKKAYESASEGYEDIALFGAPNECNALVSRRLDKELAKILEAAGMTAAEYNQELEVRTSEKYAFFSGLQVDEGWGYGYR